MSSHPRTTRYSKMEDLAENYPNMVVNGIKIRGRHRFKITENGTSHHSLIEIDGGNNRKYGYDNVIIGTLGASRTAYFIRDGRVTDKVGFRHLKPLKFDDIIMLDKKLYHIPTGKRTRLDENRTSVVRDIEAAGKVVDIRGKDKQIEWKGGRFIKYDNIKSEDVSDEDDEPILSQEEFIDKDISDSLSGKEKSYRELLNDIVVDVAFINNIHEAERYLNGEFEIPDKKKTARKFADIKRRYARNVISIEQLEDEISEFFNEHEDYIYTTFESSDTQISELDTDIDVSNDDDGGDDTTLLDW